MNRVLVVEDEQRIVEFLEQGLTAEGFSTTAVSLGRDAISFLQTYELDLVLLDLGLPDMDGLEVLEWIRTERPGLPVIVLTARTTPRDTIAALEGGAADHVAKPFGFGELVARIRLRLQSTPGRPSPETLVLGAVRLDLKARRVWIDDVEVELSARELALLTVLAQHRGQVLSRDQLRDRVWGVDAELGSNVVDVHVAAVRRKLGAEAIRTVRGVGYRVAD